MSKTIAHRRIATLIGLQQLIEGSDYIAAGEMIAELDEAIFFEASAGTIARYHSLKATVEYNLGRYREALAAARQGLDLVKNGDENRLIAELQSTIARCHTELGNLDRAERVYSDLIATYRRMDDTSSVIRTLNRTARIFFIRGQFDRAIENLMEAKDYAEQSGNLRARAMILGNLGTIINLTGAFRRAVEYLEESATQNRILGSELNLSRAYLSLAYSSMHLKEVDTALEYLDKAEELIDSHGFESERQRLAQYRAHYYLLCGNPVKAAALAEIALNLAEESSEANSSRCQSGRLLAEAQCHLSQYRAALKSAQAALGVAKTMGEDIEVGACQRVIGIALSRLGELDQAEEYFRSAVKPLYNCGADFELAQTYLAWSQAAVDAATRRHHLHDAERIFSRLDLVDLYLPPSRVTSSKQSRVDELIGKSPAFLEVVRQALSCADGNIPILLQGETGSGKDQLAKYIHASSGRANKPFVVVNCAAIPQELAESELFGYREGAFTNAADYKKGLIEAADGGTLFLNEIAELPLAIQAKLLAVLDEKKFFKLGSTEEQRVDFRLIAATNVDLDAAVERGRFRTDLYYRLAAISLEMPPLAQRGDDAYRLFEHFLSCQEISLNGISTRLLDALRERMREYGWGGNVREVKNYAELFAVTESRDPESICRRLLDRLDKARESATTSAGVVNLNQEVERFERSRIRKALTASGGVIRRAARALGVPEATLRSKMKKLQINAA